MDVIDDGERFRVSTRVQTRPRDIRVIVNSQALLGR
jgi:hypothetical protein